MLEKILKAQFPIDYRLDDVITVFQFAAIYGSVQQLDVLKAYNPDLRLVCKAGRNILHLVCSSGNVENFKYIVNLLNEQGLYQEMIESKTNGGTTPLMYAIQSGNEQLVRECLSRGMNPHASDFIGKNCAGYAA